MCFEADGGLPRTALAYAAFWEYLYLYLNDLTETCPGGETMDEMEKIGLEEDQLPSTCPMSRSISLKADSTLSTF